MSELSQQCVDVDGGTLEVLSSTGGHPVICTAHPLFAEPAEGGILSNTLLGASRVIVVNPRGLGASSPARRPQDMTMAQLVEDLEAVRHRLGIKRWVFAGPSAGGFLALMYVLRFPEALSGLILSVTGPSWPAVLDDEQSQYSPTHPTWRTALATRPQLEQGASSASDKQRWMQVRAGLWALLDNNRPVAMFPWPEMDERGRVFAEEALGFDVRDRLREIHIPTLIIGGRRDDLVPINHSRVLHRSIPQSELVVFEESGHVPMIDEAEKYRATVQSFIDGLRGREAPPMTG